MILQKSLNLIFFELIQNTEHEFFFDNLKKEWEETENRKGTFVQGYLRLNHYNLDGERTSRVKYVNTNNDATHAFYGGFCDIIVTKEKSMRTKTKFLYDFFGIETAVLSIDEFESFLDTNEVVAIKSVQDFYDRFCTDFKSKKEKDIFTEKDGSIVHVSYQPKVIYFNYFNHFQVDIEPNTNKIPRFILNRKAPGWISNHYFFDEIFKVINNVIRVFKIDLDGKLNLTDKEKEKIRDNNWSGRIWLYSPILVHLKYHKGICLRLFVDFEQEEI